MKKEIKTLVELTVLHIDFKIKFYRTADLCKSLTPIRLPATASAVSRKEMC